MDLTLACGGGDYLAGIGVDLLALGAIGALLARGWPASRWLSVALIARYVFSIVPELGLHLSLTLDQAAQPGAAHFVVGCALAALVLPLLPSTTRDWPMTRLFPRRTPSFRIRRSRGLLVFVRVDDA